MKLGHCNADFILKQFNNFLKSHECYDSYYHNLNKEHNGLRTPYIIITNSLAEKLIDKAFTWNHTEEGFVYWDELDDKWREKLNSEVKNSISEKLINL